MISALLQKTSKPFPPRISGSVVVSNRSRDFSKQCLVLSYCFKLFKNVDYSLLDVDLVMNECQWFQLISGQF